MRQFLKVALCISVFASWARADEYESEDDYDLDVLDDLPMEDEVSKEEGTSSVETLTDSSFEGFIKEHKYTLVMFYAPWCGHCKSFKPEFERAASALLSKKTFDGHVVRLAKVDATKEHELGTNYHIEAFPTIIWFADGEQTKYEAGRTSDDVQKWVDRMTVNPVTHATERPATHADRAVVVLATKDGKSTAVFDKFAGKHRTVFDCYVTSTSELHEKQEELYIQHHGEAEIKTTDAHVWQEMEKLTAFAKAHEYPVFGSVNQKTYGWYAQSTKGVVWLIPNVSKSDEMEAAAKEYRALANHIHAKVGDHFHVIHVDPIFFGKALEGLFGIKTFPAVLVQKSIKDTTKWVPTLKHEGDGGAFGVKFINEAKLVKYAQDVFEGKIPATIKSEEVPHEQTSSVRKVVGHTLVEEVFRKDNRDVLLEVYASWCKHCKEFEPKYTALGDLVAAQNLTDLLVVSKMDGSLNESPSPAVSWRGYPTVLYFPSGSETPIAYDGNREVADLVKWVAKRHSQGEAASGRLLAALGAEGAHEGAHEEEPEEQEAFEDEEAYQPEEEEL